MYSVHLTGYIQFTICEQLQNFIVAGIVEAKKTMVTKTFVWLKKNPSSVRYKCFTQNKTRNQS